MTPEPALSAVALGFVLGLQHATDPDHLVAVATIVTRERRLAAGAAIGLLWALGHTLALAAAGSLVVALGVAVPDAIASGLELAVAAMIVLLGALRLRDAFRGAAGAPVEHLLADHDHAEHLVPAGGALHSHPHRHAGDRHAHPHVHPSRRLLAALARPWAAPRALVVGAVHGLAGTGALSLLVLGTLATPVDALAYLVVFGAGTMAGMTALTTALTWPVASTLRFPGAQRALAACSGVLAVAFGLWYAASAVA